MSILLLDGSPSDPSRSAALLDAVAQRLGGRGPLIERLRIRGLPAQPLLLADASNKAIRAAIDLVLDVSAVVIATPVYKAAYSGLLKVFLDLLPQTALRSKAVLPLATGGSPHHMLALDYALRPVLQSLSARQVLPGIYATESQVTLMPEGGHHVGADVASRLDDAVANLVFEHHRSAAVLTPFRPVPFEQVRCSV